MATATVDRMLDFLCQSRLEREIARVVRTKEDMSDRATWEHVQAILLESTRCLSWDSVESIIRCHQLCIAAQPDSDNGWWTTLVLGDLNHRAQTNDGLSAYVIGSQIGLFQAGVWLQNHRRQVFAGSSLAAMGAYALDLLRYENRPANVSGSIDYYQRLLDRTVKEYLRPRDEKIAKLLQPEIRVMLSTMVTKLSADDVPPCDQAEPRTWLFSSLIHGVLNIERRNHEALTRAACAVMAYS